MRFQFKLIPTLMAVPALIIIFGLCFWQVQRLQWKNDLIDKMISRANSPAAELPAGSLDEEDTEFRPFTVRGIFDHEHEIYLVNRSLNGNPGVHVLTPLVREDGQGAILVNRGWAPFEDGRDKKENRVAGLVGGIQEVSGLLRFPKGRNMFIPDNDLTKNVWFYIDMEQAKEAVGYDLADYYLLSADDQVPGGFPIGKQWHLKLANNHLQYAITWFSLGITLLVIFLLFSRKKEETEE
ncbi:SURF1 family protein [Curvivirga sp.]|uniref:SURF1 family protein n=1 Tax=Curvivirga sp. TaxID=2856848 RepID=UPI003B5A201E